MLYPLLTVFTFIYSQHSSNPYQPLRADIEETGSQARKGTVSRYEKRLTTVDLFSEDDPKND